MTETAAPAATERKATLIADANGEVRMGALGTLIASPFVAILVGMICSR